MFWLFDNETVVAGDTRTPQVRVHSDVETMVETNRPLTIEADS